VQIKGSSYRLRERAALVPENLKARYASPLANEQPCRRRGRPRKGAPAAAANTDENGRRLLLLRHKWRKFRRHWQSWPSM